MTTQKAKLLLDEAQSLLATNPIKAREVAAVAADKSTTSKSLHFRALMLQAEAEGALGNFTKMRSIAEKALNVALFLGKKNLEADALHALSVACMNLDEKPQAHLYLSQAIKIFSELGYSVGVADVLCTYAEFSTYFGDTVKTLEIWLSALQIYEENTNSVKAITVHNKVAHLFLELEMPHVAKEHFEKEAKLRIDTGTMADIATTYVKLGYIYLIMKEWKQAESFLNKALDIFRKKNTKKDIVATLTYLAQVHQNMGKLDKAMQAANEALDLADTDDEKTPLYVRRADIYKLTNKYLDAKEDLLEALASAQAAENLTDEQYAYEILSGIYAATNDYRAAYSWLLKSEQSRAVLEQRKKEKYAEYVRERLALAEVERDRHLTPLLVGNVLPELARDEETEQEKISEVMPTPPPVAAKPARTASTPQQASAIRLAQVQDTIRKVRKTLHSDAKEAKESKGKARETAKEAAKMIKAIAHSGPSDGIANDFQTVHADFLAKIRAKFPALTTTEAKIACLVKAGMRTKEIALLFASSPHTVDTHRRRIRKKIGVGDHKDLTNALLQMERHWR